MWWRGGDTRAIVFYYLCVLAPLARVYSFIHKICERDPQTLPLILRAKIVKNVWKNNFKYADHLLGTICVLFCFFCLLITAANFYIICHVRACSNAMSNSILQFFLRRRRRKVPINIFSMIKCFVRAIRTHTHINKFERKKKCMHTRDKGANHRKMRNKNPLIISSRRNSQERKQKRTHQTSHW